MNCSKNKKIPIQIIYLVNIFDIIVSDKKNENSSSAWQKTVHHNSKTNEQTNEQNNELYKKTKLTK